MDNFYNKEELNLYRQEYNFLTKSDTVKIEIKCSKINNILIPDNNGKEIHWAKFRRMNIEYHQLINSFTQREVYQKIDGIERLICTDIDTEELDIHIIRFMLLEWSLGILQFDTNGYLTEESLKHVLNNPAPIVGCFLDRYYSSYIINKEEEKQIERQSVILFSKNSRGVDNACEAISLFCMLGNMWEKFGLNYHDLKKIPYKDYMMLRIVLGKELERHRVESKGRNTSNTRIVGPGGRTRASRGQVIENPA